MSSTPSLKSRYSQVYGTPSASTSYTPTPARRTLSPPFSTSSTVTPLGTQKVNVVTRVAIEGKAKQDRDASIRLYLKMSIPTDSVSPGSTIQLFPEESVKILTSMIHPLDAKGAPYNFSSTLCPLLHKAARALNLPARSRETYHSAHGLTGHASPPSSSESVPVVEDKYTGYIVVSKYQISYVLPKEFLPTHESSGSLGEKTNMQFVAAIDMLVPYVSRPPRAPYLLSLPTPRCLHNNIKLRIFPPSSSSSSFASLSSNDDDIGSWDLASDPHVSRHVPRSSRKDYNLADDESSDSSIIGFSDSYGIQGTFPSTERIRIRWAKPIKSLDVGIASDGRKRAGVKESKGEMTCVVKGKMKEGVLMDVEYKGTCKNVWFPGVATLLGMDVGMDARRCDLSWPSGQVEGWKISGGAGYTGFDVGMGSNNTSRHDSFDSNSSHSFSSPVGTPPIPSRNSSTASSTTSSTSSLLRAPLPNQNVAEYSFENAGAASQVSTTTSSILSSLSTPDLSQSGSFDGLKPPGDPITLHINMDELLPPAKNVFTFTISGTVVVTPRPSPTRSSSSNVANGSDLESDAGEPVVLPRFTVHAADSESTSILVRNEIQGAATNVEVYNATGDIHRDAQSRKTILQKGGFTKCGRDGGRILLKHLPPPNGHSLSTPTSRFLETPSRSRTPSVSPRTTSPSSIRRLPPKRSGPLLIPWINYRVTPFAPDGKTYAVQVRLSAPSDSESGWLEFGLAKAPDDLNGHPPKVLIASVTINGIPVEYENTVITKPEKKPVAVSGGLQFMEMSGKEWVSWVRVQIQEMGGTDVVVDYTVESATMSEKGHGKARNSKHTSLLLPTFSLPIGRLELMIDRSLDVDLSVLQTNLAHRQSQTSGEKLLHFSVEEFFYPHVSLTRTSPSVNNSSPSALWKGLIGVMLGGLLVLGALVVQMHLEMRDMGRALPGYSPGLRWSLPERAVSETAYSGGRWWFGGSAQESSSSTYDEFETIYPSSSTAILSTASASASLVPSHGNSVSLPGRHNPNSLAMIPSKIASLTWEDLRPIRTAAIEGARHLGRALHVAWRLLYRAWNYPLAEDEF